MAVFLVAVAVVACLAGYGVRKVTLSNDDSGTSTPTAASTATPTTPTAPSALTGLNAEVVAIKLAATGLPLRTVRVYTADSDPNQLFGKPGGYTSKIEFADARTGVNLNGVTNQDPVEIGGSIEVFANAANADARLQQLRQISAAGGQLTQEVDFRQDGVVLRLSRYLAQTQTQAYGTALTALAKPPPAA
ncbi:MULTISPECIES: PGRS family protein [unclassified Frankia]|uniref:PGRS family protein n=1 Tax=unclassified Frankia TaxID=2632575 RepID=UPI001EE41E1D|nr:MULTISPECIES: PGRS family protein [unclassified Frankia]